MRNILYANLRRLWINQAFWISLLVLTGLESVICLLLLHQHSMRVDIAMYVSLFIIGILGAIMLSLFYGTEYHDGTIRNKLIVGHTRNHVYLASLIIGIIAMSALYFGWGLVGGIFAFFMEGYQAIQFSRFMLLGLVGWMACVSYCAIFNLVGVLSSNKARTSIICLLLAFGMMFLGFLCYAFAQPNFLREPYRLFFQFLFDLNPFGQIFQMTTVHEAGIYRMLLYSLVLSILLTLGGLYAFQKKDLK